MNKSEDAADVRGPITERTKSQKKKQTTLNF